MDRIAALCSLVTPCDRLADIGCDHGLVGKYALSIGVKELVAADVSIGSLSKAKKLLGIYGNVSFVVGDGFDNIEGRVDQAVIAGMGGRKIIDIVSRCGYRPRLVLGPQHNADEVRAFLVKSGYRITEDKCVFDRGKFYDFLVAEEGNGEMPDEIGLTYGAFYKRKNPDLAMLAAENLKKLNGYKDTPQTRNRIAMSEEVLKWQR